MSDLDRVIGEIKGRFETHEKWEAEEHKSIKSDVKALAVKVDKIVARTHYSAGYKAALILVAGLLGTLGGFLAGGAK